MVEVRSNPDFSIAKAELGGRGKLARSVLCLAVHQTSGTRCSLRANAPSYYMCSPHSQTPATAYYLYIHTGMQMTRHLRHGIGCYDLTYKQERSYSMTLDILLLEHTQPRPRSLISGVEYACSLDVGLFVASLFGTASLRSRAQPASAARDASTAIRDFAGRAAAAGKHAKARCHGQFE